MTSRTITLPAAQVPVVDEADVVVVGGGTSGFVAATAAARAGARTILVERFGYLGGCTTTTYNTGLGAFDDSDGNQIIAGIGWEFVQRMEREGKCYVFGHRPQIWPPWTKKVALDMVEEAKVELLFYTWVEGVVMAGDAVDGLVVVNKAGRQVIRAKCVVDASGDADIAAFAGAPFEMTAVEDLQQVSCDYTACGVDAARVVDWAQGRTRTSCRGLGATFEHKSPGRPADVHVCRAELRHHRPGITSASCPPSSCASTGRPCGCRATRTSTRWTPRRSRYAETAGLRGALGHLEYLKKHHAGIRERIPRGPEPPGCARNPQDRGRHHDHDRGHQKELTLR